MPSAKNKRPYQRSARSLEPGQLVINPDDYYSSKEVSYLFNRDERTIYNWRMENKLPFIVYNRRVLFEKGPINTAVERYKRLGFL